MPDEIQRGEPRWPPRLLFTMTVAFESLRSPNTIVLVTDHLMARVHTIPIVIRSSDRSINGH
jgi:hypothetical protein